MIFASNYEGLDERTGALRFLAERGVKVDLVPGDSEVFRSDAELHFVEGLPFLTLPTTSRPRSAAVVKRSIDIVGAAIGLLGAGSRVRVLRDPDQARLSRARVLQAARVPGEAARQFDALQVPDDGRSRRSSGRQVPARTNCITTGCSRSSTTRGSRASAQAEAILPRRAAAADQRPARRDEPRRAAAADRGRERPGPRAVPRAILTSARGSRARGRCSAAATSRSRRC